MRHPFGLLFLWINKTYSYLSPATAGGKEETLLDIWKRYQDLKKHRVAMCCPFQISNKVSSLPPAEVWAYAREEAKFNFLMGFSVWGK